MRIWRGCGEGVVRVRRGCSIKGVASREGLVRVW